MSWLWLLACTHTAADTGPPDSSEPLALGLHGRGSSGSAFAARTGLEDALAMEMRFPDAELFDDGTTQWNIDEDPDMRDDIAFLSGMGEELWVVGHSLGGMMTWRLACAVPERIGGIAVVAGAFAEAWTVDCTPADVPVVVIHGTEDSQASWEGSQRYLGVEDTVDWWAAALGCGEATESGEDVVTRRYADCGLVFHTLVGHGHSWPDGGAELVADGWRRAR